MLPLAEIVDCNTSIFVSRIENTKYHEEHELFWIKKSVIG